MDLTQGGRIHLHSVEWGQHSATKLCLLSSYSTGGGAEGPSTLFSTVSLSFGASSQVTVLCVTSKPTGIKGQE